MHKSKCSVYSLSCRIEIEFNLLIQLFSSCRYIVVVVVAENEKMKMNIVTRWNQANTNCGRKWLWHDTSHSLHLNTKIVEGYKLSIFFLLLFVWVIKMSNSIGAKFVKRIWFFRYCRKRTKKNEFGCFVVYLNKYWNRQVDLYFVAGF